MRLLVVGAGATGGYFGGRLAEAGRDVTFLVRPRRAAQLQAAGLRIVSPHGNAKVRPKLVTVDAIAAPYDAVLLAVKSYSLDAAIEDFAAAVGPRTALTAPGSTQSPSMYRDLREGRPIEADQIVGDLLGRGGKAGVATPLLAAAYAHMCVYQQRLAK